MHAKTPGEPVEDPIGLLERLREQPLLRGGQTVDAIMTIRDWHVRDRVPLDDPRFRGAVPVLRTLLRDADLQTVEWACQTLGWLKAREALPDLFDLLRPQATEERHIDCFFDPFGWHEPFPDESALYALELMGDAETIPQVLGCARSGRENVRTAALDALDGLGAGVEIARLLLDVAAPVRQSAVDHLRRWRYGRAPDLRPVPPELEAELVDVLRTGPTASRRSAAEVLGHIGSASSVAPLGAALASAGVDDDLRRDVEEAIARIGSRQSG
jgi:HEAT repeat protein